MDMRYKVFRKEDFSEYALELGIWEPLVDGFEHPEAVEEIEVEITRIRVLSRRGE